MFIRKMPLKICLLVIVMMSFVACSSTATKRSFGESLDDAVITNKLKTKMMKDKTVKASQIDIDTWKGVVSLKGAVDSQAQIDRAIELAELQPGVRQVKSYLVIGGYASPDSESSSESSGNVKEKDLQKDNE